MTTNINSICKIMNILFVVILVLCIGSSCALGIIRSSSSRHRRERAYRNFIINLQHIQEEYKKECNGKYPFTIPQDKLNCEDISKFNTVYIENNKSRSSFEAFLFILSFLGLMITTFIGIICCN